MLLNVYTQRHLNINNTNLKFMSYYLLKLILIYQNYVYLSVFFVRWELSI